MAYLGVQLPIHTFVLVLWTGAIVLPYMSVSKPLVISINNETTSVKMGLFRRMGTCVF